MDLNDIAVDLFVDQLNIVAAAAVGGCLTKELNNWDNDSPRHSSMHSIEGIWGSLNCRNNNYFGMYIARAVEAFVAAVYVTELLHFVDADSFGRYGILSPHAVVV